MQQVGFQLVGGQIDADAPQHRRRILHVRQAAVEDVGRALGVIAQPVAADGQEERQTAEELLNGIVQLAGHAQPLPLLGRGHAIGHTAQLFQLQRRLQKQRRLLPDQVGHSHITIVEKRFIPAAAEAQHAQRRTVDGQGHDNLGPPLPRQRGQPGGHTLRQVGAHGPVGERFVGGRRGEPARQVIGVARAAGQSKAVVVAQPERRPLQ